MVPCVSASCEDSVSKFGTHGGPTLTSPGPKGAIKSSGCLRGTLHNRAFKHLERMCSRVPYSYCECPTEEELVRLVKERVDQGT